MIAAAQGRQPSCHGAQGAQHAGNTSDSLHPTFAPPSMLWAGHARLGPHGPLHHRAQGISVRRPVSVQDFPVTSVRRRCRGRARIRLGARCATPTPPSTLTEVTSRLARALFALGLRAIAAIRRPRHAPPALNFTRLTVAAAVHSHRDGVGRGRAKEEPHLRWKSFRPPSLGSAVTDPR